MPLLLLESLSPKLVPALWRSNLLSAQASRRSLLNMLKVEKGDIGEKPGLLSVESNKKPIYLRFVV